jgi:hypothetical protein
MSVAEDWLEAVARAFPYANHVLAVAVSLAAASDAEGYAMASRRYIAKGGSLKDIEASRGLRVLTQYGWVSIHAEADRENRLPRVFRLATPERESAHDHYLAA